MNFDVNFLFDRNPERKPENIERKIDGINIKSTRNDFIRIIDPFRNFNDVRIYNSTICCFSDSFRCNPNIFILKAPSLVFITAKFSDDDILSQYRLSFMNNDDSLPLQVLASSFIEIKDVFGDPCATEASCYHFSDILNVDLKFQWEDEFSRVTMVRGQTCDGDDSLSINLSRL